MRSSVVLCVWLALALGLSGPANSPGVVSFGDPADEAFAQAWAATQAHLNAGAFRSRSETLSLEATRAEQAKRLAAEDPSMVAVFWWTRSKGGYELFAFEPRSGQYLRRTINVAEGEEAAALESLALIIATTAEALRFGEGVAMLEASVEELEAAEERLDAEAKPPDAQAQPPPEPRPPDPEPPTAAPAPDDEPPPSTPKRVQAHFSLAYLGESVSSERPWASGVALRSGLETPSRWGFAFEYAFLLPWNIDLSPAPGNGRLSRHGAALLTQYRGPVRGRLGWHAGLGAQLELWSWRANDVGGLRPHFRVLVEAGLRFQFGSTFYALCNFFGATSVSSLDFVVCAEGSSDCSGSDRQVVSSPFWVRGGVSLGLGARF